MKYFHYLDNKTGTIIRVRAGRRPSENTKPRRGTWVCREFDPKTNTWQMPCFPEILLKDLNDMEYLGNISPKTGE